jgi:uncharacterized protein with PIN domain
VTRLKWKLVLVCLEIVLILTQDRCTVCAKRTIGLAIILDARDETLGDLGHVESRFGTFRDGVSVEANRCMVCAKCTIGLEIVLDAPDGTPMLRGSSGSSFPSFWR